MCKIDWTLCYSMMNHENNERIFHRDSLLRDNGTISPLITGTLSHWTNDGLDSVCEILLSRYSNVNSEKKMEIAIDSYVQVKETSIAILKEATIRLNFNPHEQIRIVKNSVIYPWGVNLDEWGFF